MQSKRWSVFLAAVAGVLVHASTARAVDRMTVEGGDFELGSTNNAVSVTLDLDQAILGFSVYIEYNTAQISVTDVALGSALNAPDFSNGSVDDVRGQLRHGVVLDLSEAQSERLGPGQDLQVLRLTMNVDATSAGQTSLDLRDLTTVEPVRRSVITDMSGNSVVPTLVDGTVRFIDLSPQIVSFLQNRGEAGTMFFINGQNFDQPGLTVTVCGSAAEFTLFADGTIRATAPECGPGPAVVEVCTEKGCDDDPNGFTYPEQPGGPIIDSIINNMGIPGHVFFIDGRNFDNPGLRVEVCEVEARFTALGVTGTLRVRAPPCVPGPARVQVTTNFGTDFDPAGFIYEEIGSTFLRANSNADTDVDLSDGVATLNFLFTGGATPRCMDAADADDSGEVDLTDAVFTFGFLFLGGDVPPLPYPGCGRDTTASPLTCLESTCTP